jgi:hypothetical protein
MQSSLPDEPTDRNIKAADIADSAEVAKIVARSIELPLAGRLTRKFH